MGGGLTVTHLCDRIVLCTTHVRDTGCVGLCWVKGLMNTSHFYNVDLLIILQHMVV